MAFNKPDTPHHCVDALAWVKSCRRANRKVLECEKITSVDDGDVALWLAVALEIITDQHYQIVRLKEKQI